MSKIKFEDYLCSLNGIIDGLAYDLLCSMAVPSNVPKENPDNIAYDLLFCMAYPKQYAETESSMRNQAWPLTDVLECAKTVLEKHNYTSERLSGMTIPGWDPATEPIPWNQELIAEVVSCAEAVLEGLGIYPCHPFYTGEDEQPCYLSTDCKKQNCLLRQ